MYCCSLLLYYVILTSLFGGMKFVFHFSDVGKLVLNVIKLQKNLFLNYKRKIIIRRKI